MCWKTFRKEYSQIKTAMEDIPVYKFLKRNGHTPFKNYPIILGKKLPKVELLGIYHFYDDGIDQGYHSYSTSILIGKDFGNTYVYNQSIEGCRVGILPRHLVCYKGYIPKGTKYYINENNEIVSETLVVLNESIDQKWVREL